MASALSQDNHSPYLKGILQILVALLNSDFIDMIGGVWRLGRRILSAKAHEGMFEVLEHDVELELMDTKGRTAIYRKRQRVRFLQDNIIAYQDQAWGDGDIFADYKCSPGVPVDRYREGYLYRVLISLRGTRHRGDVEEFRIERTIKDGFVEPVETLQTDVNQKTQAFSLSLIFPAKRGPKSVRLIERHTSRNFVLGSEQTRKLPDGRWQVSWHTQKPHLFEAYILRWEW